MNKEEVMKYVESHPNSRFHITTFEPIGKLQQQKTYGDPWQMKSYHAECYRKLILGGEIGGDSP
jgi:hypothetical protein